ncbi:hypothetical protein F511_44398 [Dorcoceras hygrometricum]|uniref:Uncharacterized protein n=1 Tax=Dorcoceras hygrometricum TaxID=472368 RepID=A0A2Z7B3M7_9LAMI|nr:hypothetical protein F511_44398 [Dorcoceras hygrometricum]
MCPFVSRSPPGAAHCPCNLLAPAITPRPLLSPVPHMVCMFKRRETLGLRGFFGVSGSVFEGVLTQFFANASVIAGTIFSTVANMLE